MRIQSGKLLAMLAFALPLAAQKTEGQEGKPTEEVEKLWKIQVSGFTNN